MGKLTDLKNKLKTFTPEKQEKDILLIIKDHEEDVLDFNRSQLFQGHDSEGKTLGEYHSREYAEIKAVMNPFRVVDLKFTGSLYDKMFLKAQKFPITIDSSDEKRDMLVGGDAYGEDIFGLTEDSKFQLNREVLKEPIAKYYGDMLKV